MACAGVAQVVNRIPSLWERPWTEDRYGFSRGQTSDFARGSSLFDALAIFCDHAVVKTQAFRVIRCKARKT